MKNVLTGLSAYPCDSLLGGGAADNNTRSF